MSIGRNDPGDRRQVTVLFADIVRSSDIIRQHDSEVAEGIFNQVISRQIAIVEKAGGTVNQVMGDGIMCLFGAEAPYEEHALRAVAAAQDMLKSAADVQKLYQHIPLKIRIGINTGEVVLVRRGKDRYAAAFQATGETVHATDRVLKQAQPNRMLVSAATRTFLDRYYVFKKMGSFKWHADADAMDIFEPIAPKKPAVAQRGDTPMIHRPAIEARIDALLTVMDKRQEPKIIWLYGAPGMGKTHLVNRYLLGKIDKCIQVNFYPDPIAEDPAAFPRKVMEAIGADRKNFDAAPDTREKADIMAEVLLKVTARKPIMLVLEDMQWAKEEALVYIERLIELYDGREHLYIVATSRHKPPFHAKKMKPVLLDPMSAKEGDHLLAVLDVAAALPRTLRRKIYTLSAGNPYFIHEYFHWARDMISRGVPLREVSRSLGQYTPGLVADAIYNKLSGAGDDLIRIAKIASVLGMRVHLNILHALCGEERKTLVGMIKRLEEADILKQNRIFPEAEWVFTHELLQKVIYHAIPKRTRATWHREVIRQMGRPAFKTIEGRHMLMAQHAEQAGDPLLRYVYLKKAAHAEAAASRHETAIRLAVAARKTLAALPRAKRYGRHDMQWRIFKVSSLFIVGQYTRAQKHLAVLMSRKAALKKYGYLEQVLSYRELYLWIKGDLRGAAKIAKAILSLAAAVKKRHVYIRENSRLGNIYIDLGRYRDAVMHDLNVVRAIPDRAAHEKFDLLVAAKPASLASLALAYAFLGDIKKSHQYFMRAYTFAENSDDDFTRIFIFVYLAHSLIVQGQNAKALVLLTPAVDLCGKSGASLLKPYALSAMGIALVRLGKTKEGFAHCRDAVAAAAKNKLVVRGAQFTAWCREAEAAVSRARVHVRV